MKWNTLSTLFVVAKKIFISDTIDTTHFSYQVHFNGYSFC